MICPGWQSLRLDMKVKSKPERKMLLCSGATYCFTTYPFLPATKKGSVPTSVSNNIVYNFSCHCDTRYIGRTSQRLQDRIRQHVPRFIRTDQILNSRNTSTRFGEFSILVMFGKSSIGQHFLNNLMCVQYYNDKKFTILSFGHFFIYLL